MHKKLISPTKPQGVTESVLGILKSRSKVLKLVLVLQMKGINFGEA